MLKGYNITYITKESLICFPSLGFGVVNSYSIKSMYDLFIYSYRADNLSIKRILKFLFLHKHGLNGGGGGGVEMLYCNNTQDVYNLVLY